MSVQWLFFDVGYTLINEDQVWRRRFEEQAFMPETAELGLSADEIRQDVIRSSIERKPQYRTFVQKYALTHAAPYRHELEEPYVDACFVLKELSQRYRLGIIANQTDGLRERLASWGLLAFFSAVVSSWDHQIMKPDKRLFEIALEEACCTPQEAVMIGDRLDNDICPAKKLGMKAIWIRQGFAIYQDVKKAEYQPDYVVDELAELKTLF